MHFCKDQRNYNLCSLGFLDFSRLHFVLLHCNVRIMYLLCVIFYNTLNCSPVLSMHLTQNTHTCIIPACCSNVTTPSFPLDTLSFLLFPKLYINSVGLYGLVFCLSARCASIRHQLPATFTGCKHLSKAFHLVNVARGPRGSGLAPR